MQADDLMEQVKEYFTEGDYFNDKGELVCGKCGQNKDFIYAGERFRKPCACDEDERMTEYEARIKEQARKQAEVLRKTWIASPSLRELTFDKDDGQAPEVTKMCWQYVEHFPEFYEKNIGAMLRGGVGTGKTFFACCIANELINRGYTAYVTSMPEILTYMAVGEERRHVMDKVLTADLLVLDDWGVERDTSYAVEQVYYVIDSRLKVDKPMLITTNLSEEDLHSAPSLSLQRIYDRVLEVCPFIIEINTGSRRPQSADKKRKELFQILAKGIDNPNI